MLKFTTEGIIYGEKLYKMSQADMEWVKAENKKAPMEHPARNLRSMATVIEYLD